MKNSIFTDSFTKKVEIEFVKQPEKWGHLYWLATLEENETMRKQLDNWAASVPTHVFKLLRPKLINPDTHIHTRNELRVCFHLSKAGFDCEYEKEILNQTPDLIVSKNGHQFIVEIFTADVSVEENKQEKIKRDLTRRITSLPHCVGLRIRTSIPFSDTALNKIIVREHSCPK